MMVDQELIDSLRESIVRFPGVKELAGSEAAEMLDRVAVQYVVDPAQLWWWTTLSVDHETIKYRENDGLNGVADLVPPQSVALLVITDDEPRPWPVFCGKAADLLALLRETRFCEYFLGDPDLGWLVFDTHHNALVVTGSLIGGARPS